MESRALVATLLTSFVTNFLSCGEQLPELKADEYLLPSGAQLNLDDEYGCVPMAVGKTIETPAIELTLLGIYRAGAHIRAVRKPQ